MHFGSLPLEYEAGHSHLTAPARSIGRELSRRSILGLVPAILGFAGGTAAGAGFFRFFTGGDATVRTEQQPEPAVLEGSIEWAQWIQRGPATEFLAAAGELERLRMRAGSDPRLPPVFVSLLDTALERDDPSADPAGQIAVRCLARLGADQHLWIREARIRARTDLSATVDELERNLERLRRGRRR